MLLAKPSELTVIPILLGKERKYTFPALLEIALLMMKNSFVVSALPAQFKRVKFCFFSIYFMYIFLLLYYY